MKRKHCYVLLVIMFAVSCRKITDTEAPFTSASYPLAVGDWWQYQLTSIGSYPDTFTLMVDSMVADGPYIKYICNYIGNGAIIPAGYFLQSDTSMSFVQPYGYFTSFPSFHLKFPVKPGQYWPGSFAGDSTMVVGAVNSCQVTDGAHYITVGPCYTTYESYDLPHNFKVENMTLTSKIGLVNQSIDFNSDTAYNGGIQIQQNVTLISYHVQ